MPRGNPSKQTLRNARWNAKAGYKSKSFALKGDIADRYREACEKVGRSQASVIQELMQEFIDRVEEQEAIKKCEELMKM